MRVAVFVAIVVVAAAAFFSLADSFAHPSIGPFASSVTLALAAVVQRISAVQKWLSGPREWRKEQVDEWAQQALMNVARDKLLSDEVLSFVVHVWAVPRWYRRLLPYRLRCALKRVVSWKLFRRFDAWVIRPAFQRTVAFGLVRCMPSGVPFKKGRGLVGVCVLNNDRSEFVTLSTDDPAYQRALRTRNSRTWKSQKATLTHNLEYDDALKLSHSYGQVIGRVVQAKSGEAIGCVTVSSSHPKLSAQHNLIDSPLVRTQLKALALGVSPILSS
jgi:hypothetical protein